MELDTAEDYLSRGRATHALPYLAQLLRRDPANQLAAQ